MKFSKNASLNLSVNAIVILILAVTMLGLGLTFMKGAFSKATGQLEEVGGQIKEQVIDDIESSGDKLVFLQTEIEVKKGDEKTIYFGIRNDVSEQGESILFYINDPNTDVDAVFTEGGEDDETTPKVGCYDSIDDIGEITYDKAIKFSVLKSKKLKQDEVVALPLKIKVDSNAPKTTYSCAMVVYTDDGTKHSRKDFYITVE